MKNLWKVTFAAKYGGLLDLQPETVQVIGNGDGLAAVKKARRMLRGKKIKDGQLMRRLRWVKLESLGILEYIDG